MIKKQVKQPVKQQLKPETIKDLVSSFQHIRVLLTAFELKIFTVLSNDSNSSIDVSKKIKAAKRSTDRLLNALVSLGYLVKKNDTFSNTEFSEKYFVKGKPAYMSSLMHSANLWHTWSTLTESVIKGTSVKQQSSKINDRGEEWLESFIAAMHYRAAQQADEVVKLIDMKGVSRVLDLGGGSGAYAMAFVRAKKGVTATVYDLPNVIPLTKKYIHNAGYADQITVAEGDYSLDKLPLDFDMIFLSAVVHINSMEENSKLIKKCTKSLRKSGTIVILDQIMDESRTKPLNGAMFALNMLVGTEYGDTYTESEMTNWFIKAGLTSVKRVDTPFGSGLMIGKR